MSKLNIYRSTNPFILENGEQLDEFKITYHTYGTYDADKNNVVWVCHALTANSDVFDWWKGVFGEDDLFNPKEYFIVCANIIGSHYGSSGPLNTSNKDGYLLNDFPFISTKDMAKAHELLRVELKIEKIHVLIGASLGGQQALEWVINESSIFDHLAILATNARHSAFGIAFNETQRLAIYSDPTFGNRNDLGGKQGLISARAIAMLSYRSYEGYRKSQTNDGNELPDDFKASSYQRYQGKKLADRFNAYSYVILSKAMDAHNVGRNRISVEFALQQIKAKTLVIGIESDLLFPIREQEFLSDQIPNSTFRKIHSDYGHDGFLIETEQVKRLLKEFLKINE